MHAASPSQPPKKKRPALGLTLFGWCVAALGVMMAVFHLFPGLVAQELRPTQASQVIRELRFAILSYQVEYDHLPIPQPVSTANDVTTRSSGPLLLALLGGEASPLNPKSIKFYEGPFDSNSKHGLWQDDSEWVLRDRWGESYYIVLDTNNDGKIANPDPDAAKTAPEILESVLIYSSGPDRDPKTWQDNICSWLNRNLAPAP